MNELFAKRFKQLRNENNKTQDELLKEFNNKYHYSFKKSSISMYENGKRMPEVQALADFAKYFEVTTDYLLGISDIRNPYKEENKDKPKDEIITIAAHHDGDEFTDEEKKEIENFMKWVIDRKKS